MCCVEGMDEIGWEGGGLFEGVDGGVTGLVAVGDCLEQWKEYLKSKGRKVGRDGKGGRRRVDAWVDLEILELPARGGFEISKVRESKYFFH